MKTASSESSTGLEQAVTMHEMMEDRESSGSSTLATARRNELVQEGHQRDGILERADVVMILNTNYFHHFDY
jgi:hypothetical protein